MWTILGAIATPSLQPQNKILIGMCYLHLYRIHTHMWLKSKFVNIKSCGCRSKKHLLKIISEWFPSWHIFPKLYKVDTTTTSIATYRLLMMDSEVSHLLFHQESSSAIQINVVLHFFVFYLYFYIYMSFSYNFDKDQF